MNENILNPLPQQNSTNPVTTITPIPRYENKGEPVNIPSQGIFYKENFKNIKSVILKHLDSTDEDILTTESYYTDGTIFNEIIKNCLVGPDFFSYRQLIPVDRDAILIWLRIGAFGKDYELKHTCPKCAEKKRLLEEKGEPVDFSTDTIVTWDLSQLKMPELNPKYIDELTANGEIKIQLPISKINAWISIPSIGKVLEIEKSLSTRRLKEKNKTDYKNTLGLLSILSCIEKEGQRISDWSLINSYLKSNPLPLGDSRFIKTKSDEIKLAIEDPKDITCKTCGYTSEGVDFPINNINFFWPEFVKY